MRADMPGIRMEGLTKDYGSLRALDGVDLEVERGEIVGFLGPNGAGKTTAVRLLLDLIRPTRGRAEILGHDCQRDALGARAGVGYVPGELGLPERVSGRDYLALVAALRRCSGGTSAERAEQLGLDLEMRIRELSSGNRRKLAIVAALVGEPPVLLLDEPTASLDPVRRRDVFALIRERSERGAAVLFSTHVLSEAEELCDRVAILDEGRLVAEAPIGALVEGGHLRLEVAIDCPPGAEIPRLPGLQVLEHRDGTARLIVDGEPNEVIRALAGEHVREVRARSRTLEDAVLDLLSRGG